MRTDSGVMKVFLSVFCCLVLHTFLLQSRLLPPTEVKLLPKSSTSHLFSLRFHAAAAAAVAVAVVAVEAQSRCDKSCDSRLRLNDVEFN